MRRTQIYITDQQRDSLISLEGKKEKSMGALIREAIDEYLSRQELDWKSELVSSAGLWEGREDLPDFQALREELDR